MWQSDSASSSSSQTCAVSVEGVTKRFGGTVAVDGVELFVPAGQAVALVGPSGAGKTTLLELIAGSVSPDVGGVRLDGQDLSALRPGRDLAALVGVVAQQYDLVPNLSALQNVLAGRLGVWSGWRSLLSLLAPRDKPLAMRALERVGIAERSAVRAGRLSGGEQQRVAIARVMVQDPEIVLADEPVASLDPARAEDVLGLLVSVAHEREQTLVASMHAVELAQRHFDRLVGLRNGRILFDRAAGDVSRGDFDELYLIEGSRVG